jgi:hypothetical protein
MTPSTPPPDVTPPSGVRVVLRGETYELDHTRVYLGVDSRGQHVFRYTGPAGLVWTPDEATPEIRIDNFPAQTSISLPVAVRTLDNMRRFGQQDNAAARRRLFVSSLLFLGALACLVGAVLSILSDRDFDAAVLIAAGLSLWLVGRSVSLSVLHRLKGRQP